MYQLKESIIIKYENEICLIYFGTTLFEIEDPNKYYFNLFSQKEWDLDFMDEEFKGFLIDNNLITIKYSLINIDPKLEKNIYYFENKVKHTTNPVELQNDLSKKKVIILGCGGVGTVVIKNLISMGVRDLLIIDFDKVENSNLNRQLFFEPTDIGKIKNEVLKGILENYDENIRVKTAMCKVLNKEILRSVCSNYDADFFINCADYPKDIFKIVVSYCREKDIPSISSGVGIETGYWGPIINKGYLENIEKSKELLEPVKGSISTTNMIISSLVANDVLEYWINPDQPDLYKKKIFNFNEYSIKVVD